MIALQIALAAAAAFSPVPAQAAAHRAAFQQGLALCELAVIQAGKGDLTWLERGMDKARYSEEQKTRLRNLCWIYLQGRNSRK